MGIKYIEVYFNNVLVNLEYKGKKYLAEMLLNKH